MGRPKKIKPIESSLNNEVIMSDTQTLESLETEMDRVRIELEATKKELEEKKNEVRSEAGRIISRDEQVIIDKQINTNVKNKALKAKIEQQRQLDNVIVTGKFINRRVPGQSAKLAYIKYESDPVKWYTFEDGKVYDIPRGFADQIRDYYHTPKFTQRQGDMDPNRPSSVINEVDTSQKKYDFVPVGWS